MKQFVRLSLFGSRNQISESNILKVLLFFSILRISFFSASFPFFNNVDEPSHVDLVVKYSQAKLPTPTSSKMEPDSARLFVLYGTPEYLQPPQPKLEPFWKQLQKDDKIDLINNKIVRWMEIENHESLSPPFYYVVWGMWHKLGIILRLDKYSLYWLKILNILFMQE